MSKLNPEVKKTVVVGDEFIHMLVQILRSLDLEIISSLAAVSIS